MYLLHGPIWSSPCFFCVKDVSSISNWALVLHIILPWYAWAHMELTMPLQIHKHPSELSVPLAWAHVELSMLVCQVSVWHSAWLRSATSQDIILSGFSMGPYGAHHASANRLKANVCCCTSGTGPSGAHYAYIIDSFSFIQRKCKNPEVKTSSALLSSMGPYGAHHASANILSSKCTGCTSSMGSCGALHASLTIFTVIRGPLAAIVSSLIAWAHMELTMLL